MTDGYATSQIIQAINSKFQSFFFASVSRIFGTFYSIWCIDTINERRLNQVGRKPIKTEEFIVELAAMQPIFTEQEDAFTQWFEKTPIGTAFYY